MQSCHMHLFSMLLIFFFYITLLFHSSVVSKWTTAWHNRPLITRFFKWNVLSTFFFYKKTLILFLIKVYRVQGFWQSNIYMIYISMWRNNAWRILARMRDIVADKSESVIFCILIRNFWKQFFLFFFLSFFFFFFFEIEKVKKLRFLKLSVHSRLWDCNITRFAKEMQMSTEVNMKSGCDITR